MRDIFLPLCTGPGKEACGTNSRAPTTPASTSTDILTKHPLDSQPSLSVHSLPVSTAPTEAPIPSCSLHSPLQYTELPPHCQPCQVQACWEGIEHRGAFRPQKEAWTTVDSSDRRILIYGSIIGGPWVLYQLPLSLGLLLIQQESQHTHLQLSPASRPFSFPS